MASAVIAAAGALVVGYLTQFLSERYRRFKDGAALAAGIAGELDSYRDAAPTIKDSLERLLEHLKAGRRDLLRFRPFEKPEDSYFPRVVEKIGLLGPDLCERIIYTYANINAFRSGLVTIHQDGPKMDEQELKLRIELCLEAADRGFTAGRELVPLLKLRSQQRFCFCG